MNTPHPSLADVLAQADLLYARDELEPVIAAMGARIDAALGGERAVFLTVMNGALIFAGQLALAIRTDLEFDYVHATRYRGETTGSELHWLREPAVPLAGRVVLLVDDILDEGHTLKEVREPVHQAARSPGRRHRLRFQWRGIARPLRVRLRHGLLRAGAQPAGDLCVEGREWGIGNRE